MVSALASGTSGLGLSPDQTHCVVFLDKKLYYDAPWRTKILASIYIELVLFKDNLLLHIYNLFSACKTCCCIHLINFWPNSCNMFSKLCTCVNVCATLVKHIQLVFQHTTCRIRLNFYTIFIKLILKIPNNLAPNMCVTIKYSQLL